MPAILILCVLLHVVLLAHVLRHRPKGGWLLLILMLPGAGALLYFLLMVWDVAARWARLPTHRTAARARVPDAESELHHRRATLARKSLKWHNEMEQKSFDLAHKICLTSMIQIN